MYMRYIIFLATLLYSHNVRIFVLIYIVFFIVNSLFECSKDIFYNIRITHPVPALGNKCKLFAMFNWFQFLVYYPSRLWSRLSYRLSRCKCLQPVFVKGQYFLYAFAYGGPLVTVRRNKSNRVTDRAWTA